MKTVLLILVIITFAYGMWYLERKVNYFLSYETMVKNQIKQEVKGECLVESPR
jgi:hypothetical protein